MSHMCNKCEWEPIEGTDSFRFVRECEPRPLFLSTPWGRMELTEDGARFVAPMNPNPGPLALEPYRWPT